MPVDICPDGTLISELDYQTHRQKNLDKIGTYYQQVLNEYTNQYQKYASKKLSDDEDVKDSADYMIEEQNNISTNNDKLIEIQRSVNTIVLDDFKDIEEQVNQIKTLEVQIRKNDKIIEDLNQDLSTQENRLKSITQNLDNTRNMTGDYKFNHNAFITVAVLLGITCAILIYQVINMDASMRMYSSMRKNNNDLSKPNNSNDLTNNVINNILNNSKNSK